MASTLADIRAKLQAQAQTSKTTSGGDNGIFPHWNIDEGQSVSVRFLPDGKSSNTFFWVERAMIKLPFAGIKGQADSKPVVVQVPCVEMWGDACPILAEVRPWFKDKSLEDMGRKYWKKRSYVFQGFVRINPLKEDPMPENPIRRFIIGPQIFNTIKSALLDPEFDNLPTDYDDGLDFKIIKTSKGGYADYNTSSWSRKSTALTADEKEAIEKFGLYDLSSFLPRKPGVAELAIIKEMFEASVDGQAYDSDKFSHFYRPYGVLAPATSVPASVEDDESAPVAAAPVAVEPEEAAPVVAPKTSGKRAEDIINQIRNRNKTA